MERGYKSDNSDSKINAGTECPRELSYFSPNKSENRCFSPVNRPNADESIDHVTSYTDSMESRSDANFIQSRASIPCDSYSNKNGLDKLNVCKTTQVNLDKEPIFNDNYGNQLEPKRGNR